MLPLVRGVNYVLEILSTVIAIQAERPNREPLKNGVVTGEL